MVPLMEGTGNKSGLWKATLVAVLTVHYPTLYGQPAHNYLSESSVQGGAWVSYGVAYRRQAATRRSLEWAVIDTALYN